jgi:signal peptidase I
MTSYRPGLLNLRLIIFVLLLSAAGILMITRFMVIRVREDSMSPTLRDGQWALVLRGSGNIHPGDIAVFISPVDNRMVVKRYIFGSESRPVIDHGWLITPWGRWFLTGSQWKRLEKERNVPGGMFFMVGDNQFRSLDSRNYGYVQADRLIGRVLLRRKHG